MTKYTSDEVYDFLIEDYPDADVTNQVGLLEVHSLPTKEYLKDVFEKFERDGIPYFCYFLPVGKYGALLNKRCNGVRYGPNGDYISLPNV